VFATQQMLAEIASRYLPVEGTPARAEIRVNVTGINHFTWIDRAMYGNADLLELLRRYVEEPGVLRPYSRKEVESWGSWFRSAEQVKFTLFQRFGLLAAAGDRHLVEFLPGFIRSPEELFRWGIIRTPVAWRISNWQKAPEKTRDLMAGREPLRLESSGEEGVGQIRALVGLGDLITNVNLANRGQIPNLSSEAVVETNAAFSRDEVRPLAAGPLPAGLQPIIARHIANQELIIKAALACDKGLAFQAVLGDPTHQLPLDEAWSMFREMLGASREFLPGWTIE
jgi:alpha-galactosidase